MAAGPVGSVWASGSWSDTCWEEDTWAGAVPPSASGGGWMLMLRRRRGAVMVAVLFGVGYFGAFVLGALSFLPW